MKSEAEDGATEMAYEVRDLAKESYLRMVSAKGFGQSLGMLTIDQAMELQEIVREAFDAGWKARKEATYRGWESDKVLLTRHTDRG